MRKEHLKTRQLVLKIVNYAGNDKKIILRFDICISLFSYHVSNSNDLFWWYSTHSLWNLSDRDIFTGTSNLSMVQFFNSVPVLVYSSSWYDLIHIPSIISNLLRKALFHCFSMISWDIVLLYSEQILFLWWLCNYVHGLIGHFKCNELHQLFSLPISANMHRYLI